MTRWFQVQFIKQLEKDNYSSENFQKMQKKGTLEPDFRRCLPATLIPKPDEDTSRKLETNISDEHMMQNPSHKILPAN